MTEELKKIEDKINTLVNQRDKLIADAEEINKELIELSEEYKEKSGMYVRVCCLGCGGVGYIQDGEKTDKKRICRNPQVPFLACNGKGYVWLKKYDTGE